MGDAEATMAAGSGLAEAHRQLLADKSLQFDFFQAPPDKPPPDWLTHLLAFLGPILKYVFWGLVIVAALLVVAFIIREIVKVRWRGRAKPFKPGAAGGLDWRPKEARARLLLAQADALAAEGRYAEAAHHLLLHSIQDVEDHRPRAIRPALTSRDIARLDAIPRQPKAAFARIAELVERSFFGGAALDATGFAEARAAYETFAFEGGWG
jgi:hypothetical protein